MKRKAHYPVTHTEIKTFTVSAGAQQVSIDNAFLGPIPEKILIAMVKNTAFVGSAATNSFHFHHFDMTNFVIYVNGVQHSSEPLTMNCSSPFGATGAYETLFFEYWYTSR
jgi:DeoR/GlpR family transcriptional regulator of sugar metabolism